MYYKYNIRTCYHFYLYYFSYSSLFYNLHIYDEAFTRYNMGYAAAMAWFLLVIVMTITLINLVASKYWVHTEEGDT